MATMIGQLHSVVIDAPDPHALATFYAGLLGMDVKGSPGDDWVVITGAGHRIAFQEAPDLQPPDWPDPDRPQQFHLDFRVYADPVGHPFCLVWDAA
jgi:catechol-2,3-dioxygenase